MPILTEEEHRWKYWMPQEPSDEFVEAIPESIRSLKIFDPAVGSGHFLIIAFTVLAAFYEEEARHLCKNWEPKQIAEWIIEENLHGVDIDPRAVQIAAAAVFLKAKTYAKDAAPSIVNLVASNFGIASLPKNDQAILDLKQALKEEIDLSEEMADIILEAISQADYLGSLLKIDEAVQEAIAQYRRQFEPRQLEIGETVSEDAKPSFSDEQAEATIFENLVEFLNRRTSSEDLGLRLRGEQLAAGVRFIQLVRKGEYDLVIANPPYLGAGKMQHRRYIEKHYSISKADLYAVFIQRGIELVDFAKLRGLSAMITMRGWMFIKDYEDLRAFILPQKTVSRIGIVNLTDVNQNWARSSLDR
ncbi:DNA methyltransferase [Leptolyngbya sp. FACHB-17]|uniref:Eco57I restriction-modification methylase domain-containing protein n=1 Tax=unclassified Leptolyngbya TaxID=2650499 RepID=UPI001F54AE13|nr:DNA methyltransferase [Leptolyngbya sp. FACHB-17]